MRKNKWTSFTDGGQRWEEGGKRYKNALEHEKINWGTSPTREDLRK
jgi:hypothetical protein